MIKFKKTSTYALAYDEFLKRNIVISHVGSDGVDSIKDAENKVLEKIKSSVFAVSIAEMSDLRAASVMKGVEGFRLSLENDNLSPGERNVAEIALQLFKIANEDGYEVVFEELPEG